MNKTATNNISEYCSMPGISLLTAQDVSTVLQISEAMAYLLMQRGQIPTVRIGRVVRVRTVDLDKFITGSMSNQ